MSNLMPKVLDGLTELHKIDQQLVEVQRETERLPEALAESEQELAALEEKRAGVLKEAQDKQVAADKSDLDLKDLQGKKDKYVVQLNIVKNQKQYDTLKH
ncbi:MAG: zinc ribbon domain-containing protein, partial [Planctomycetota bacterium]